MLQHVLFVKTMAGLSTARACRIVAAATNDKFGTPESMRVMFTHHKPIGPTSQEKYRGDYGRCMANDLLNLRFYDVPTLAPNDLAALQKSIEKWEARLDELCALSGFDWRKFNGDSVLWKPKL